MWTQFLSCRFGRAANTIFLDVHLSCGHLGCILGNAPASLKTVRLPWHRRCSHAARSESPNQTTVKWKRDPETLRIFIQSSVHWWEEKQKKANFESSFSCKESRVLDPNTSQSKVWPSQDVFSQGQIMCWCLKPCLKINEICRRIKIRIRTDYKPALRCIFNKQLKENQATWKKCLFDSLNSRGIYTKQTAHNFSKLFLDLDVESKHGAGITGFPGLTCKIKRQQAINNAFWEQHISLLQI